MTADDVRVVKMAVRCDALRVAIMSRRCAMGRTCGWEGTTEVRQSASRGLQTFWCPACQSWTVQGLVAGC